MKQLDGNLIQQALELLGELLRQQVLPQPVRLVVCGGAGLICSGLASRTTRDVDVVALLDAQGQPTNPDPLPAPVLTAVRQVATVLDLGPDWLNNGPSRGTLGLFQGGLPLGFADRLTFHQYGPALTVYLVGRLDQVFFKLYAAADQGPGRHYDDLRRLEPTDDELRQAVAWATTHDPSDGFKHMLQGMLNAMGHHELATRIL